MTVKKRITSGQ